MSDIRAIVLDFDGVVVESVDLKNRAFGELFRESHPDRVEDIVEFQLANIGLSRLDKFPRIYDEILGEPFPPGELERLDRAFSQLVFDAVATCPSVPGADRLIRGRSARQALYVASATPENEVRRLVERRGLAEHFRAVFGAPASKPDILRGILEREGYRADEVVFVGDAANDLSAARATGIRFVGRVVPGTDSPFPPDVETVDDLDELDVLLP